VRLKCLAYDERKIKNRIALLELEEKKIQKKINETKEKAEKVL